MPHMDGTETLRLIREIDDNVHIIVVLGYASAPLARELLQQGAYDFFQKPVDLAHFKRSLSGFKPYKIWPDPFLLHLSTEYNQPALTNFPAFRLDFPGSLRYPKLLQQDEFPTYPKLDR